MSRARNIKPGFFKNEVLAEMPCEARLLFVGLWTLADREGRLEDRPKRIKAELFAFDSFDVDAMLSRLQRDEFLTRYEAAGKRYIQIENFVKHQDPHYKEKASEIPAPPGRENLVLATGVTRTIRARILERDAYACVACGAKEHLCIDHILPVSRGGDSSDENLQVLCMSCNTKKGNKLDGETKNWRKPAETIPWPDDDSTSTRTQDDKSARSPLTPDSLIPDSGFRIPDSLIPEGDSGPAPALAPPPPPVPPPAFLGEKNESAIPAKAKVPLAEEWELPERWGNDAEALGFTPPEILREAEKFRQYHVAGKAAGTRRSLKGWRQGWSNWLGNAERFRRAA